MLPDKEFSKEQILNIGDRSVKLNPLLTKFISIGFYGQITREVVRTCLFTDRAKRSALIPDDTSHSMTASVVD